MKYSLGDKIHEIGNYQASKVIELNVDFGPPRQKSIQKRSISKVTELCFDAADSLLIQFKRNSPTSSSSIPLMIVMSDDPEGIQLLRNHPRGKDWRIISVNSVTQTDDPQFSKRKLKHHHHHHHPFTGSKPPTIGGFIEGAFNQYPLSTRIALTNRFMIDLTVLGKISDGIIFTGSSNVSKLLGLLGGEKRLAQRSIRSLDVRWHPTARYTR